MTTSLLSSKEMPFWESGSIYIVRAGSRAYGTNLPSSDEDIRGVCIPPAEYIIGLKQWEQHEDKGHDRTIYGLHKFVRLALNCNPNIIELLHVREEDILHITESGRRLRRFAPRFLSKRAFKTFGGYAFAQLQLIHKGKTARHGSHVGLVGQHGWDTKNGLHLIRLLRMGVEILRTGQVHTYRPDRTELLDIRHGRWSLDQMLAESDRLNAELKAAYEASFLPDEPDYRSPARKPMPSGVG
mgnify:FL=1